ncbi:conserved hypothetical protein [Vibrio chagasii]|nr:conserved hypothetical protein [Vibrio chagasii]
MTAPQITIASNCKLSPITHDQLNEYCYYALKCLMETSQLAQEFEWPEMHTTWSNSEKERDFVKKSFLGETMTMAWEYAEQGLHFESMSKGAYQDPLIFIYRWVITCDAYLVHHGKFGNESLEVNEMGSKLLYKLIARLKLDLQLDMDHEFGVSDLFPMAHPTMLTSHEYALLAGFSHIGAVRNEVANKENPLLVKKKGNQILVPIESAISALAKKRKFTPTRDTL